MRLLDHDLLDPAQTKEWQRVPIFQRKFKAVKETLHRILRYFSMNQIKSNNICDGLLIDIIAK